MTPRTSFLIAAFTGVALAMSGPALAKNNGNGNGNGWGNGKSVWEHPGKGPKIIPPGQIKRYTRGAKLPGNLKYKDIVDLSKWKLSDPGKGYRYIQVDKDVLKVTKDLSTVIEAVGIVSDLLK